MNRREMTAYLSALLEERLDPRNDQRVYWANEVTFGYSADEATVRVDYMQFKPKNNTVSGIEKKENQMVDTETLSKLFAAFPNSSINASMEFIADHPANQWFRLDDCSTRFDVEKKVIQYLSRGAYKTEPFYKKSQNDRLHKKMLNGLNAFCGTRFRPADMELIYTYLGNGCNAYLCDEFIRGGYNLEILRNFEESMRREHAN